jgi:hypothetical protein
MLAPEGVAITAGLNYERNVGTQFVQEKCFVKQIELAGT